MKPLNLCGFFLTKQVNERTSLMVKLVDSIMRGRANPSSRNEAAAAVSDIRTFVRAWRPTPSSGVSAAEANSDSSDSSNSGSGRDEASRGQGRSSESATTLQRPSADALLKLAQVCEARNFASSQKKSRLVGADLYNIAWVRQHALEYGMWHHLGTDIPGVPCT